MHTPFVFRLSDRSKFLIVALCVAVVALRVSGLHAHLCMDGSEPPVSFHVADSGVHHADEADAGGAHDDRDLAIASDVVVKKPYGGLDVTVLAAVFSLLLFLLARPQGRLSFPPLNSPLRSPRMRLRPEPRGPPRLA